MSERLDGVMGSSKGAAKRRKRWVRGITYAVLIVLGTAFTLPFFWLVSTSFKPAERIQRWPPDILPMQPVKAVVGDVSRKVYAIDNPKDPSRNGARVVITKRLAGARAVVKPLSGQARPFETDADYLIPQVRPGLNWSNYFRGLRFIDFRQQLSNTLNICFIRVQGTLISCSLWRTGWQRSSGREAECCSSSSFHDDAPISGYHGPLFALFVKLRWVDTFCRSRFPRSSATRSSYSCCGSFSHDPEGPFRSVQD